MYLKYLLQNETKLQQMNVSNYIVQCAISNTYNWFVKIYDF